jgi:UDP-N-acetylglucosamine--N-acetylmuramyl-(pentapeptide) pyrophosphoryl-undecaprenol N-acetylglucosamine transferase
MERLLVCTRGENPEEKTLVHSVCHQPLSLKPRRVLVATGGTGGHLFPAVALAQDLLDSSPGTQICFAGGGLVGSPFLLSSPGPWGIIPIEAPKLTPSTPVRFLTSLWKGWRQSRALLEEFQPEIIIGFGSYHTLPLLIAAQKMGIPYVLHEGNAVPGRVNRLFAPKAACTAVHFASAAKQLRGNTAQVAMPLRSRFQAPMNPQQARKDLGLSTDLCTLLVLGGSQGAQALNALLRDSVGQIAQIPDLQIIHLTGPKHIGEAQSLQDTYTKAGLKALVKPFEERMELAWRASDICIARSGASSLAEQMACRVPGILVPFPSATDDHQTQNALSFADQVGGAIVIPQHELSPQRFGELLHSLLEDQQRSLLKMKESMLQKQSNYDLQRLSDLVAEVAGWDSL